ncbi:MAG: hypothetical protein PVJ09_03620 [Candidatus Woesebacteria bacterium]|jgi:hypothetical protein
MTTVKKTAQSNKVQSSYQKIKQNFLDKHQELSVWLKKNSLELEDLKDLTQQLMAAVSLAGQVIVSQPVEAQIEEQIQLVEEETGDKSLAQLNEEEHQEVINKMISFVNIEAGHLAKEDELYLEQQLNDILGFEVTAELDSHRLNHSIGIMGGEQHLKRFPTDTLAQHDAYLEAGLAENRGAFGWFSQNMELTEQDIQREKYYFAVQTLYLPDWNTNYKELKPWYKFRKMIVINPNEELAVVGVVADAGPAQWVKKQFGGSPEVIREGKIWSPKSRGKVILFFVDDPNDEVPLGVIDLNWKRKSETSALAKA